MSNLRRSRPDKQDASLRRLQEISLTHHRLSSSDQTSPPSSQRAQQDTNTDNKDVHAFQDEDSSPHLEVSESVFQPEGTYSLASPISPKPRTRTSLDSVGKGCTTESSPMSPSRKYVKMLSSPMLSSKKIDGRESVTDKNINSSQRQSVTDKRWEKLRSLLLAMKDEPFNVEECLNASPDLLVNLPGKLGTEEELRLELSTLQGVLKQKKLQLQQAEEERDSALAFIRHLKVNSEATPLPSPESGNDTLQMFERGIEGLRESNVSKDSVLALMSPLVKELHRQKLYLDRLITVTLMRVPWIFEEVDKMELPDNKDPFFGLNDNDEDGNW